MLAVDCRGTGNQKIFSPIKINNIIIKNRIIMSPMATFLADDGGKVNERLIGYYERRAKGGVGLIITEPAAILKSGIFNKNQLRIYDEESINGYKELTSRIHKHGTKIILQLNHAGRQTFPELTGGTVYAPSPISCKMFKIIPKELSLNEIDQIIESFIFGARRAKELGFDGIEIQAGHGYLLNQFLSGLSNKRNDIYGNSYEGKFLIIRKIIQKIKNENTDNFLIACRISADEMIPGGITIEQSLIYAKMLADLKISFIDVSACNFQSFYKNIPHYYYKEAPFIKYAIKIKKTVNIPVMAVGKIHNIKLIEKALRGNIDFVGLGRQLITDPDFIKKIKDNDEKNIKTCLCCNKCFENIKYSSLKCAINPEIGHESIIAIKSIEKKNIAIIGTGPAGLNAAYYLQKLGHQITIYEKNKIGGKLNYLSRIYGLKNYKKYLDFLKLNINSNNILIKKIDWNSYNKPDLYNHIIVASGSKHENKYNIGKNTDNILNYDDIFYKAKDLKNRIIIIGLADEGAQIAFHLMNQNKEISVIESTNRIAYNLSSSIQHYLNNEIKNKVNNIFLNARIISINKDKIIIKQGKTITHVTNFDEIFISREKKSNQEFQNLPVEKYTVIGDALNPSDIKQASYDGFNLILRGIL